MVSVTLKSLTVPPHSLRSGDFSSLYSSLGPAARCTATAGFFVALN